MLMCSGSIRQLLAFINLKLAIQRTVHRDKPLHYPDCDTLNLRSQPAADGVSTVQLTGTMAR